jgi:GDPmannose 4,6-dehydratase
MKSALITGITGQDGSYLTEFLLDKGYTIFGLVRRLSNPNILRIEHILDEINLVDGDMTDQSSLNNILREICPNEIYNLAAQSFVGSSWNQPALTGNVTGLGAVRLFEAIRQYCESSKVYQASSSEMFGKVQEIPQNENTKFYPRSPYGCAKAYAYWLSVNYRESYNMNISNGIMFNHESPRRGIEFVSRKITNGVSKIYRNKSKELKLGNIYAKRDWGYAKDYVEAMWLMLQQKHPDDYVIATGVQHSVQDFLELAFSEVKLNWKDYVKTDTKFMRPAEVDTLVGDYSKAKKVLKWTPKTTFGELVRLMVNHDLQAK